MKVKIELGPDDSKEDFQKTRSIIDILEKQTNQQPSQSSSASNNNKDNGNGSDDISIVIRDGGSKKTIDVKEDLKHQGFTYYKYKKNSKKEDPRYTQRCSKNYWNDIKDQTVFEGLNIWTSDGGGSV